MELIHYFWFYQKCFCSSPLEIKELIIRDSFITQSCWWSVSWELECFMVYGDFQWVSKAVAQVYVIFFSSFVIQELVLKLSCQSFYLLFGPFCVFVDLLNLIVDLFRISLLHRFSQVEMIERRYITRLSAMELSKCTWVPFNEFYLLRICFLLRAREFG